VRLAEGEARARFGTVPVARLGTADAQGQPHVVVVTFAVRGDMIYTAVDQKPKSGTNLKRLRNVAGNPRVTMLTDEYSDDWDTLWWVRADGRAVVLADPQQMAEPLRLLAERYWQYREAPPTGPVLAVTVERWSGWAASYSLFLLGLPAAVQSATTAPRSRPGHEPDAERVDVVAVVLGGDDDLAAAGGEGDLPRRVGELRAGRGVKAQRTARTGDRDQEATGDAITLQPAAAQGVEHVDQVPWTATLTGNEPPEPST
jgi:PPOX class probable F420-dependent enzyme